MVSGQAFVLYSRLHLVVQNKMLLRGVLVAIIMDGLAFHIPTLIFIPGANSSSPSTQVKWTGKFNVSSATLLALDGRNLLTLWLGKDHGTDSTCCF